MAISAAKRAIAKAPTKAANFSDPRVDAVIAKAAPFAQPILRDLRVLVHKAEPSVAEEIKWSRPFFILDGKPLCFMTAFKEHCGFGFWSPAMTKLLTADGVQGADASGSFGRIRSMDDLPPREELLRYIRHAAKLIRAGEAGSPVVQRRTSAKPPVAMPAEFAQALAKSAAADSYFETLAPSCKREYLEWITGAKRPETRQRRVDEAVKMLSAGRRFNDKYR